MNDFLIVNNALEDAFGFPCASMENQDRESLKNAPEIWREEIDRLTTKKTGSCKWESWKDFNRMVKNVS